MKSKDGSFKGTIKLKALGRVIQEKREDAINYRLSRIKEGGIIIDSIDIKRPMRDY